MNSVLLGLVVLSGAINLSSQYGYNKNGVNQMRLPAGANQNADSTYSQTTTYQQQPNGQQTSYVQETVQQQQQPSGATKTVVTKTITQPGMTQPTSYNNDGSTIYSSYGGKK